jgi:serine acetyltransferase
VSQTAGLWKLIREHWMAHDRDWTRPGRRAVVLTRLFRQGVTIGNRRLDAPFDAPRPGARVSVGAGAQILGAISVGDDARIGANAVVLDDVPSGATAVGVPAVVVRRRPAGQRSR